EEIANDVTDIYCEIAVAKVAHSEHLKGILPSKVVDDELRSEASLTMALLGLIGEEAVIAPRIGGKYRRKRGAASGRLRQSYTRGRHRSCRGRERSAERRQPYR